MSKLGLKDQLTAAHSCSNFISNYEMKVTTLTPLVLHIKRMFGTEVKLQLNVISEPVLLLEALLNEANDTAHSE